MGADNTIFRRAFTDIDGTAYTLYFIPGGVTDLSAPATVDLPDYFLLQDDSIVCSAGFKDDIPLGMEQTRTMKFTVDVNALSGTFTNTDGTYNYSLIQTILERGCSATKRTYTFGSLSSQYYIPNRWRLLKGTTVIFDGFQSPSPSYDLDLDDTKHGLFFSIECTDIATYILKIVNALHIQYQIGLLTPAYQTNNYQMLKYNPSDNSSKTATIVRGDANLNLSWYSLTQIYDAINSAIDDIAEVMLRETAQSPYLTNPRSSSGVGVHLVDDYGTVWNILQGSFSVGETISITGESTTFKILQVTATQIVVDMASDQVSGDYAYRVYDPIIPQGFHTYYKADISGNDYDTNGIITPSEMYVIGKIQHNEDDRILGGIAYKNYPRGNFFDYESLYDFLNDELTANGLKGVIRFGTYLNPNTWTFNIAFYRVFDSITSKTIDNTVIIDPNIKFSINANYMKSVNYNVKEFNDIGIQTYEYNDSYGSGSDNTLELNPFFTNQMQAMDSTVYTDKSSTYFAKDSLGVTFQFGNVQMKHTFQTLLYFYDTILYKIHDYVKWNLGDSIIQADYNGTFTVGTVANTPNLYIRNNELKTAPYHICKLLGDIFQKQGEAVFEANCDGSDIEITDLGDNSTFTDSSFNFDNITFTGFGSKALITSVETDILQNETKIKGWTNG